MLSSPRACRKCGRAATKDGHCDAHQLASARGEKRIRDDIDRRYGREPWPSFRLAMLGQNPMCQRIQKDGTQCRQPARVVHHIWSPRVRPDLFVDPKNVVCVCLNDHPPDEGTPWWRAGIDFVETQFRNPIVGEIKP